MHGESEPALHGRIGCGGGFIRKILGWREYVRGIYWTQMPKPDEPAPIRQSVVAFEGELICDIATDAGTGTDNKTDGFGTQYLHDRLLDWLA